MSARSLIVDALAAPRLRQAGFGVLALSSAVLISGIACADIVLDGDAKAMVLTVSDVSRPEVLAELSRRFGFAMSGTVSGDDPVNGRFRGELGDVLGLLLPSNNFLVIYEGGRPAKILLSERGEASAFAADPAMRSLRPNQEIPGEVNHGGNFGGDEEQFVDPSQGMQDPALQDQSGEVPPPSDL